MMFVVNGRSTNRLINPVKATVAMGSKVLRRFSGAVRPEIPSACPPLLAVRATATGRAVCREK
jgi:hypothetical protein